MMKHFYPVVYGPFQVHRTPQVTGWFAKYENGSPHMNPVDFEPTY